MVQLLKTIIVAALLVIIQACSSTIVYDAEKVTSDSIKINHKVYTTLKGFIQVNEDFSNPQSRRIFLPFYIIKSNAKNPSEPIFWLDGGPGGTNIVSEKNIISASPEKLLDKHDFVCVGYRGVDGSTVLASDDINNALKGLNSNLLSSESIANVVEKIKDYTAELKKENIDINKYTILDVIEDIEHARKFLGYKSINLLSVSYGTRVALLYGYKYPEIVNKTVMIGACPPNYFLVRPEQAERTIAHYDSIYKKQKNFNGSIREAMRIAFQKMPSKWSLYKLDADKIKTGTMQALYSRGFAVLAFDAYFNAAYNDDYSGLFMLQKVYDMSTKSIIGDVFAKTVSADQNSNYALEDSNTILGKNISEIYAQTAKYWQIKSIPAEYTTCKYSEEETLVVSGDLDFRTPAYITEKELMPHLKNGKHVILKNMSHTDVLINVMKTPSFLQAFYDDGIVDTSLIETVDEINFEVKERLGKLKIFAMGILY